MEINEAPYHLVDCDNHEWHFEESASMSAATEEFDRLRDLGLDLRGFGAALQRFLKRRPAHVDALHHYAIQRTQVNKPLEALAFEEAAVAAGRRAFPAAFQPNRDRLPTDFVQNRPFLRSLHGLMLAQWNLGLKDEAIRSGQEALAFDPDDRMGARLSLVALFVEQGRAKPALALFEAKQYRETFHTEEYLHALALLMLDRELEARRLLQDHCLNYYPQVARFLLNPAIPPPPPDRLGGIISGSDYEGWYDAGRYRAYWNGQPRALEILREEARPFADRDWKRFSASGQTAP